MEPNDDLVRQRAKRAYELGRLSRSVRSAWPIAPMAVLIHPACSTASLTIGAAVVLLVATVILSWRGEAFGKAVYPGLLAGFLAAVVPMSAQVCGACSGTDLCAVACVLGGVCAGAIVAYRARSIEARSGRSPRSVEIDRARFIVSAGFLACVGGSMGCALAGFGGLAGMAAGLLVPTAPILIFRRA